MFSSSILLRPSFWYAFIGLVIVVLFIYGMGISQDRTDLTKAKRELEQRTEELSSCNNESELKSNKISELSSQIKQSEFNLDSNSSLKVFDGETSLVKYEDLEIDANENYQHKERRYEVKVEFWLKYYFLYSIYFYMFILKNIPNKRDTTHNNNKYSRNDSSYFILFVF